MAENHRGPEQNLHFRREKKMSRVRVNGLDAPVRARARRARAGRQARRRARVRPGAVERAAVPRSLKKPQRRGHGPARGRLRAHGAAPRALKRPQRRGRGPARGWLWARGAAPRAVGRRPSAKRLSDARTQASITCRLAHEARTRCKSSSEHYLLLDTQSASQTQEQRGCTTAPLNTHST